MVDTLSALLREMSAKTASEAGRWPESETLVATLLACSEVAEEQEQDLERMRVLLGADPPPSSALEAVLGAVDTGNLLVFPGRRPPGVGRPGEVNSERPAGAAAPADCNNAGQPCPYGRRYENAARRGANVELQLTDLVSLWSMLREVIDYQGSTEEELQPECLRGFRPRGPLLMVEKLMAAGRGA